MKSQHVTLLPFWCFSASVCAFTSQTYTECEKRGWEFRGWTAIKLQDPLKFGGAIQVMLHS